MEIKDRVYFDLSGLDWYPIVDLLFPLVQRGLLSTCKIHHLYDSDGKKAVEMVKSNKLKVWIDYKLHEIPRMAGLRAAALFKNGADIVTVMAKGGEKMIQSAVQAARDESPHGKIYAVTVLTSLSEEEYGQPILPEVIKLAKMAANAGAHGVVCSGLEVGELSQISELKEIDLVVPATRLPGAKVKDQKRVVTQREAIARGATHLVIGSEATEASDPVAVLKKIHEEIEKGLEDRKN